MKKLKKGTLTRKLDRVCSLIVRSRGICERCGEADYDKLQCCHIYSRTYRNTRWDFLNLLCLCAKCHFWSHRNPILFVEWLRNTMTEDNYDLLMSKAQEVKKWREDEMLILLQDLERQFEEMY